MVTMARAGALMSTCVNKLCTTPLLAHARRCVAQTTNLACKGTLYAAMHTRAATVPAIQSNAHVRQRTVWIRARGFAAEAGAGAEATATKAGATVEQNVATKRPPGYSTYAALGLFTITAGGLVYMFNREKQRRVAAIMKSVSQPGPIVGDAMLGGPFKLVDSNNRTFTDKDLNGGFSLLYFGFTLCPDICPDELHKVSAAVTKARRVVAASAKTRGAEPPPIKVVFISVDPERDTPKKVKAYTKKFMPDMIGLTGSMDAVKKAAKSYRVYFTKTDDSKDSYLVDHSIIHYLLDPQGKFQTFFGKTATEDDIANAIVDRVSAYMEKQSKAP